MIRWLIVVLVLFFLPATGTAAGIDRIWNCSYRDCSVLTAQAGDSLDTSGSDTTVLGATDNKIRTLDAFRYMDQATDLGGVVGANPIMGLWNSTATTEADDFLVSPMAIAAQGTLNLGASPLLGGPALFLSGFNIKATANILGGGIVPFQNNPKIIATTGTTITLAHDSYQVAGDTWVGRGAFAEHTSFEREGTGAFDASANWTSFAAFGDIEAGVTLSELKGFRCGNVVGSGGLGTRSCFVVEEQTRGLVNVGIENNSTTVNPPGTAQTLTASSTIAPNRTYIEITSTADRTLTTTPTISNGVVGQVVTLLTTGSHTISLQDDAQLTNSNLFLGGCGHETTFMYGVLVAIASGPPNVGWVMCQQGEQCDIGPKESVTFIFTSANEWVQTDCMMREP